jgi:hypothetical protein
MLYYYYYYYYTPTIQAKLLTSDNSWDLFSRRFVSVAAERSWRVRLCSTTTTTHQQYKQNYWLLTTLEISSLAVSCLLQQSVHGSLNLNVWVYIYIYIYIYIFTEQLLNAHHPSLSLPFDNIIYYYYYYSIEQQVEFVASTYSCLWLYLTRGVSVTLWPCHFTLQYYLEANEELWKFKYFTTQKNI